MPVRGVRRRYLYIVCHSVDEIHGDDFERCLLDKLHFLYGVTGVSEMNPRFIEWNNVKQSAIIRVNHLSLPEMRTALSHITQINTSKVRLDVIRVSGTIKSLKSKLLS